MADDGVGRPEGSTTIRSIHLIGNGGYEKIMVKTESAPKIKTGHILVRVKACGMNFSDLLTRQGVYSFQGIKPPFNMGLECAGVVEEVASDVQNVQVGERVVCWSFNYGMWTELACVPEAYFLPIPENMTYEEAVALPIQYVTAYLAVMDFGSVKPGQSIFIQACAGGVGWAATQIAKTVDNVTVFGTASSTKHDLARENGVQHVIDYKTKDYVTAVKEISPKGVDVVLDCLGGHDLVRSQKILCQIGKLISIGVTNMMSGEKRNYLQNLKVWWQMKNISFLQLINNNLATCGIHVGTLMEKEPERFRETLLKVIKLYEEGKIKPKIDSVYPFEQVVDGTKRIVERQNIGKVVLVPLQEKDRNSSS